MLAGIVCNVPHKHNGFYPRPLCELVTHSHPFHDTHSHSKTSLVVIGHLSTFCSPEVDVYEVQHPMRTLLAVLKSAPATPTVKGEIIRSLSLRAPPAFFL